MIPEAIRRYVTAHQPPQPEIFERLRQETAALRDGRMLFSRDSAMLVSLLVRAIGARHALEVGTFTGCSSLAIALSLPHDGRLICCDVSEEWTAIARRYWHEAHVDGLIELRLAPASETLAALAAGGAAGAFDFALIDADKQRYVEYYDRCVELLRRDGLLCVDNTLWGGTVADESVLDEETSAIRTLNQCIRDDPRVEACLLTIGDGLTVVRKR